MNTATTLRAIAADAMRINDQDSETLLRAASFISELQRELDLSQGEVGSLSLWITQLKDTIIDLEGYIDRLQTGPQGSDVCIRTYDLGESLREVPSPSLPIFGNYTVLCSEAFGTRMADGGSRQDLPYPKASGKGTLVRNVSEMDDVLFLVEEINNAND